MHQIFSQEIQEVFVCVFICLGIIYLAPNIKHLLYAKGVAQNPICSEETGSATLSDWTITQLMSRRTGDPPGSPPSTAHALFTRIMTSWYQGIFQNPPEHL